MGLTVHHNAMQKIIWLPFCSALVLVLNDCANNGGARNDPLGTGPFDSQGNYHEEWANDPSKWSKPGKRGPQPSGDDLPLIAKNDQPPPNATPLVPGGGSYSKTPPRVDSAQEPAHHAGELKIVSVKPKTTGTKTGTKTHVASTSTSKPKTHVASTSTSKLKSSGADTTSSSKPKTHVTSTSTTKSKSSGADTTSSSKPKTHIADTSTPKPKSSSTGTKTKTNSGNYTVKKGDSLELIARHSGKSVTAIKKANGMSGEMIHPGQTLVVPK